MRKYRWKLLFSFPIFLSLILYSVTVYYKNKLNFVNDFVINIILETSNIVQESQEVNIPQTLNNNTHPSYFFFILYFKKI